jgi:uncharacterized integral membrane protein
LFVDLGSPAQYVGGKHQSKLLWKVTNNGDPLLERNKKCKAQDDPKCHSKKWSKKKQAIKSSDEDDADDESEEQPGDELDKYKRMRDEIADEEKVCMLIQVVLLILLMVFWQAGHKHHHRGHDPHTADVCGVFIKGEFDGDKGNFCEVFRYVLALKLLVFFHHNTQFTEFCLSAPIASVSSGVVCLLSENILHSMTVWCAMLFPLMIFVLGTGRLTGRHISINVQRTMQHLMNMQTV